MKPHKIPGWVERGRFRRENRKWLGYSSEIVKRIAVHLEADPTGSQKKLAKDLDVSPQFINKVLKGECNLTLKTIAKLSDILGEELIEFPSYKYSVTASELLPGAVRVEDFAGVSFKRKFVQNIFISFDSTKTIYKHIERVVGIDAQKEKQIA
jgi:transcriptional regulator with XRE-family HTH domain